MPTSTYTAASNGKVAGTDACDSTSSTGAECAGVSFCDSPILDQEGHYWDNFTGGVSQSWWDSTGTLKVTYDITSGGNGTPATDIVELQYSLNNGSSWTSFSGFPKTVDTASGTATKTGISAGQNLADVQVRLISKAASCSPCDVGVCNYSSTGCTVSNIKLEAAYTVPTGACCTGASCAVGTEASCGGTYYGDGTTCSPSPCGDPTGRCCTGAVCTVESEASCTSGGGTYGGDGTGCGGSPCSTPDPDGSCCNGSVCTITTEAGCGGTWTESGTCSPNPCAKSPIALCVG